MTYLNILLFTSSFLGCPKIKVENITNFSWNALDEEHLERASKRCGELYLNSPCLKLFKKIDERDYQAICGKKLRNFK